MIDDVCIPWKYERPFARTVEGQRSRGPRHPLPYEGIKVAKGLVKNLKPEIVL